MNRAFVLVALVLLLFLTAGCIPGPNSLANSPDDDGQVSGFWQGLWHGVITPITFIVSLFTQNVHMYDVYNNGAWYNFGYLLGLSIVLGGGSGGAASRRSRR